MDKEKLDWMIELLERLDGTLGDTFEEKIENVLYNLRIERGDII